MKLCDDDIYQKISGRSIPIVQEFLSMLLNGCKPLKIYIMLLQTFH